VWHHVYTEQESCRRWTKVHSTGNSKEQKQQENAALTQRGEKTKAPSEAAFTVLCPDKNQHRKPQEISENSIEVQRRETHLTRKKRATAYRIGT